MEIGAWLFEAWFWMFVAVTAFALGMGAWTNWR